MTVFSGRRILTLLFISMSIILTWLFLTIKDQNNPVMAINNKLSQSHFANIAEDAAKKKSKSPSNCSDDVPWPTSDRLGVLVYLPNERKYLEEFVVYMYGSWKYIAMNAGKILKEKVAYLTITPDMLVFCSGKICDKLPDGCQPFRAGHMEMKISQTSSNFSENLFLNLSPQCYFIHQDTELDTSYGYIQSYVMFTRDDIKDIGQYYKYFMRTDMDCFLSPAILTWKLNHSIGFGRGGYSQHFNQRRLKKLSAKMNMTHRGVHNLGSTWYGTPKVMIPLAKRTILVALYLFDYEFDPSLPGLETIEFGEEGKGEWPRWYKSMSSMYAAEMVANDMIDSFDESYQQPFDSSTCWNVSVWQYPHIHCWQKPCEFMKFHFRDMLYSFMKYTAKIPSKTLTKLLPAFTSYQDASDMTLQEYSFYIAWTSVLKYYKYLKW